MIRRIEQTDIHKVAEIWLNTNLQAHDFIEAEYWKGNYEMVKEMFALAEIYVYEENGEILGFVGLDDQYIAGIFVSDIAQSRGIGKELLDFVKNKKEKLSLNVYQKNTRAFKFYLREGFVVQSEGMDEATGENEISMSWELCYNQRKEN